MSSTAGGGMRNDGHSRYAWLGIWTAIWVVIVLFVLVSPEDVERCRAAAGGNEAKYCGFGTMIAQVAVGIAVIVVWAPVALLLLVIALRDHPSTDRDHPVVACCPRCQAELMSSAATCPRCRHDPPGASGPPTGSG